MLNETLFPTLYFAIEATLQSRMNDIKPHNISRTI
jgi:hypothetical protein